MSVIKKINLELENAFLRESGRELVKVGELVCWALADLQDKYKDATGSYCPEADEALSQAEQILGELAAKAIKRAVIEKEVLPNTKGLKRMNGVGVPSGLTWEQILDQHLVEFEKDVEAAGHLVVGEWEKTTEGKLRAKTTCALCGHPLGFEIFENPPAGTPPEFTVGLACFPDRCKGVDERQASE